MWYKSKQKQICLTTADIGLESDSDILSSDIFCRYIKLEIAVLIDVWSFLEYSSMVVV